MSNAGTIKTLTNRGAISGGSGGSGPVEGAEGDAIYSAGANASIGTIANSGSIVGSVVIDNQTSVTVTGGSGKTFGSWTGGTITIGAGNLTFAGGSNTALGDNISVNGGLGTVTNADPLHIASPRTAPLGKAAVSPQRPMTRCGSWRGVKNRTVVWRSVATRSIAH